MVTRMLDNRETNSRDFDNESENGREWEMKRRRRKEREKYPVSTSLVTKNVGFFQNRKF